ncbi:MAG: hypothetical protein IKI66_08910 [Bacteroidales bacterium]|nr:hypothetical protein [Bacteroidales bacterium]
MKRLIPVLLLFGLLPAACLQDSVSPANEPEAPSVGYDAESLTRTFVILTGSLRNGAGIAEYGFELAETSFSGGEVAVFSNPPKDAGNTFSLSVTLKPGVFYVLRSFISNGSVVKRSPEITFKAPATAVATVSDVEFSDGQLRASILDDGGRPVKEAGFCWGESPYPGVIRRNKLAATLDDSGTFSLNVTSLEKGKTYYILAYAENSSDGNDAYGYSENPFVLVLSDDDPVSIEDPAFSRYLTTHFDRNRDGALSYRELAEITAIDVSASGIRSLKGIELMPELTALKCTDNQIAALDLSNNPRLKTLAVDCNPLTVLDISTCPDLSEFSALRCTQLVTVYVAPVFTRQPHDGIKVPATVTFALAPAALIPFPDANLRRYLVERYDQNGDDQISVAESAAITTIDVSTDYILSMSGIEFLENLTVLVCRGSERGRGRLDKLDVSWNGKLQNLDCQNNRLTALDVSHNARLQTLCCGDNPLQSLDVTHNPVLTELFCWSNALSRLDLSQNPSLGYLRCYDNQLTSLDLSRNGMLQELYVSNNRLTGLDVHNNPYLNTLQCGDNQITALDVDSNPELVELICYRNLLSSLEVSRNVHLNYLDCSFNKLSAIDVSNNPKLGEFNCSQNQLSRLDVSQNHNLVYLYCSDNQLAGITGAYNSNLVYLICSENHLASLELGYYPNLKYLSCHTNELTVLDMSGNLSLNQVLCYGNPSLSQIWLKTGQTIQDFLYDTYVSTIFYK